MENQDADIHIVQSTNANKVICVMPTTNTPAEAVARGRKRAHEATSSAVQSITPGGTGNAPARSKKRGKRSPLPITAANPANAPVAVAAVQVARAPPNMGSTRTRIIINSRENLGEEERAEDATDDNLQAIGQHKSTLDDGEDDDDQRGGGEKGTTSSLAASNRRYSTHKSFENRFEELLKFKQKFGHCNAPHTKSSEYYSLGMWSSNLRRSYNHLQKGETPNNKLTDDHIRRLEEAGFKWTLLRTRSPRRTFDEHFEELLKFKQKFGHCNDPQMKSGEYYSLGKWCTDLRTSYKRIQKGETPRIKLALGTIRRLEEAGFNWQCA